MNETSRPEGGPPHPLLSVSNVRDVLARVTRALEALRDGDGQFAEQTLDDLAHDLCPVIEPQELGTR